MNYKKFCKKINNIILWNILLYINIVQYIDCVFSNAQTRRMEKILRDSLTPHWRINLSTDTATFEIMSEAIDVFTDSIKMDGN